MAVGDPPRDENAGITFAITGADDPLACPQALAARSGRTDGRTEILKVLSHDHPPRIIRCGPTACT
jgi:hypothetical protein